MVDNISILFSEWKHLCFDLCYISANSYWIRKSEMALHFDSSKQTLQPWLCKSSCPEYMNFISKMRLESLALSLYIVHALPFFSICSFQAVQCGGWYLGGCQVINSLWSCETQRSGSILAQVMACCLVAPSHYLNQCWLIIIIVQWHSSEGNFTKESLKEFSHQSLKFAWK